MRPNQDHATLYTGHRLVSNSGFLPDLSRECGLPPVLMSSFTFRYVIGGSLAFVFIDPYQTRDTSRLPVTLNTLALYQSILRWFGGAPCWAPPVGLPPSHAQHSCQEIFVNWLSLSTSCCFLGARPHRWKLVSFISGLVISTFVPFTSLLKVVRASLP